MTNKLLDGLLSVGEVDSGNPILTTSDELAFIERVPSHSEYSLGVNELLNYFALLSVPRDLEEMAVPIHSSHNNLVCLHSVPGERVEGELSI